MGIIILFQFGLSFVSNWICAPSVICFIKFFLENFICGSAFVCCHDYERLPCIRAVLLFGLSTPDDPDSNLKSSSVSGWAPQDGEGGVVGPWKGSSSSQWDDIECVKQLKSILFIIWSTTVRSKTSVFFVWIVYFEVTNYYGSSYCVFCLIYVWCFIIPYD